LDIDLSKTLRLMMRKRKRKEDRRFLKTKEEVKEFIILCLQ